MTKTDSIKLTLASIESTPLLNCKSSKSSISSNEDICLDIDSIPSKLALTSKQKWILLCLCLVDLCSFSSMSIIAPFFPYEIYLRSLSDTVSGFIFALYSLTVVVFSVIFGKLAPFIGPKFMLISGVFVSGFANITFGFLNYIQNNTAFISFCFIVRIIEAIGAASFNTASLIFVFKCFPNHISSAFSWTETFTIIGTTIGPALGGLLYSSFGYCVPFFVLGTFVFINLPLCYFFVPKIDCKLLKLFLRLEAFVCQKLLDALSLWTFKAFRCLKHFGV